MSKTTPPLDTKPRTGLYVFTRDVVAEFDRVIQESIRHWIFLRATPSWSHTDFHGKRVAAGGCEYEGSIRNLFWRFSDPFLENAVRSSIATLLQECERRHLDVDAPLTELQELLHRLVRRSFNQMAEIDRRLRGRGYPQTVQPEDVTPRIESFARFVDERIASARVREPAPSSDIVSLRPGIAGFSIDLRQAWRYLRRRFQVWSRDGTN